ncbi:MAG: hypothetical protein EXX96DRAFT_521182, partial [Benjaminiella poitrasii]
MLDAFFFSPPSFPNVMSKINIQVFTDFDGTLSLDDTGLLLIDDHRSLGPERRRQLEHEILNGSKTY